MRYASALLVVLVLAGCITQPRDEPPDDTEGFELVSSILPEPNMNIDILFVIDNSGSMMEEQEALAMWAQEYLFGIIELTAGMLPSLHIGVVSTDLGTGPYNISNCGGAGDDGVLQTTPRIAECVPPTDAFIRDVANPDGTRERNYTGDLGEAFACISVLGVDGCGFEQPLEAMRRALTHPANAGFLRDDALLAVVFVGDEDDCSVIDTAMFSTAQTGIDEPLGPLSSFRCFEFGVTCNETDPRAPGSRTGCTAGSSAYMSGVESYIDFLQNLKPDPSMVMVAGIFGDAEPVEVTMTSGPVFSQPLLAPSCTSAHGEAMPGVRLAGFLDGFPARNQFASICEGDIAGPLQAVATLVGGTAARSPCLREAVVDTSAEAGIQPACRVRDVIAPGTAAEQRFEIPACSATSDGPCFTIFPDATRCAHTPDQLAVQAPAAGHLLVECRTAP